MLVIVMISFELTALGFAIAWPMDSTQAFHAIVNMLLIPLWLLSGALFPAERGRRLDALLHDAESLDLWSGSAARQLVSRYGYAIFPAGQPGGDGRLLRADFCRGLGDREPAHQPPIG